MGHRTGYFGLDKGRASCRGIISGCGIPAFYPKIIYVIERLQATVQIIGAIDETPTGMPVVNGLKIPFFGKLHEHIGIVHPYFRGNGSDILF
ncbi:hypothetical protein D3C87_1272980 [compost metagenome]